MRGRSALVAGVLAFAAFGGGASAHTGWSVEGSVLAAVRSVNCGVSPTCQAFALSGCNTQLAATVKDGVDASIVQLPAGTGGHRAKISWTTAAGPLGEVVVQFLAVSASNGACGLIAPDSLVYLSGSTFTVNPGAQWVAVMGVGLVQMDWKIEGVAH
jgi:hypothetical protein